MKIILLLLLLAISSCTQYESVLEMKFKCEGVESALKEAVELPSISCPRRLSEALENISRVCKEITISESFCGIKEAQNDTTK